MPFSPISNIPTSKNSNSWFTMIEMMIVIAIIVFLFSMALFPYNYYMERSYVERTIDSIWQEWILAHKDIRNGKMFDIDKHANKVLIFRKGSTEVEQYLLSGSTIPPLADFRWDTTNSDIRKENPLGFDSKIQILGFSGANITSDDTVLGYLIEAPYGSGAFFTEHTPGTFSSTGIFLTIGYIGADTESGRARKVLLKPYLQ